MSEQQNTYIEQLGDGVVLIRLGANDEKVVTLTVARLASLRNQLIDLEQQRPAALIIAGPHQDMFTAGADINLIRDIKDPAEGEKFAREGQKVFDILERLPFPTVAAISGPCVGGGCELVLACRYRIATDQKSTLIGLPEVKLGIIPGFGGTQRLPRLVGISKALDLICAGKTLKAAQALKFGLVDLVCPYSVLIEKSKQLALSKIEIKRQDWGLQEKFLTKTALGRKLVMSKVLPKLTKGVAKFYPAPKKAASAVVLGLQRGVVAGLECEAKEIGQLITSEQSKNLVSTFFATEAAKGIGKAARNQLDNLGVMVIGAGTMGAGIAQVFAASGYKVILRDTNQILVEKGQQTIRSGLDKDKRLSTEDKSEILKRVSLSTPDIAEIPFMPSLVVEAIFEDIEVKKKVLGDIAKQLDPETIIATNTSSLSISQIASAMPNPQLVAGLHFFNPAQKMPLIEIVRGKQTSDRVVILLAALSSKLGKTPVVVEDVPGFLVNRILFPYLAEALKLLGEGYAIESIDSAALDYGMPMGPIRLLDEIGLDVAEHVSKVMVAGYGERMKGPDYLAALVAQGRKGRKNGAGFFTFESESARPWSGLRQALNLPPHKTGSRTEIERRLFGAMQAEAKLCYNEGVAGQPGAEALAQINLASIMGIGYPAFRGGVLKGIV